MTPSQIIKARHLLGLNQTELAAMLGWTSKKNIGNLEVGAKNCTIQTALAIECLLLKAGFFEEWNNTNENST